MTAQQLRLIGENAQQPTLPVERPECADEPCPWCQREQCSGGPDCKYVSPYQQEE